MQPLNSYELVNDLFDLMIVANTPKAAIYDTIPAEIFWTVALNDTPLTEVTSYLGNQINGIYNAYAFSEDN